MSIARAAGLRAAQTYRQVDIAGRTAGANDSQALVGLLYDEAIHALRAAAHAAELGQPTVKSERLTRATACLFALEAGLDFERGGDVARTLATFYAGVRQRVIAASVGNNPEPFRSAANDLADIAEAWEQVRAG